MANNQFEEHEPLVRGLPALPRGIFDVPRVSPELRGAILVRTSKAVRTRPRRLQMLAACAVTAAYAAGAITVLLAPGKAPAPGAQFEVAAQMPLEQNPQDLLTQVPQAAPEEQVRLLTAAGDLYLTQWDDIESALSCYKEVLERTASAQPPKLKASDSWLLASLKLARLQEKSYKHVSKEVPDENQSS